jgi:uncharacterized damage-inducible protein DinB
MVNILTKEDILRESEFIFKRLLDYCTQLPDEVFFAMPEGKWTIAQHVQHLIISTRTATAAYALPAFLVRIVGGKSARHSVAYNELLERYERKLSDGGKASGRYIPAQVQAASGKTMLIKWQKVYTDYLKAIENKRTEEQLDAYIVKHPLLGTITLRELCYFTIFHTAHHLKGIKNQAMLL